MSGNGVTVCTCSHSWILCAFNIARNLANGFRT